MNFLSTEFFAAPAAAVLSCVFLLWIISLRLRDVSIVDIFWGSGFIVAFLAAAASWQAWDSQHVVIIGFMVAAWGLRLSFHLFLRNHGAGEDPRYANWRREVGPSYAWKSLIYVFVFQGLLILVISLPVLATVAAASQDRAKLPLVIGLLAWAIGLVFEAVGDYQLRKFKSDPNNRGMVMDRGLWRYTRHPNYFGDSLVWWGIWLTTLDLPAAPFLIISPLLMTLFLTRISGVPLLEKSLIKSKPGYADYVKRTSGFIPLPPRKRSGSRQTGALLVAGFIVGMSFPPMAAHAGIATRFDFQPRISIGESEFPLVGTSLYRHFGLIKVFAAGLYTETSPAQVYPSGSHAKVLEIVYFVDIDAEDFAEITQEGIERVVGKSEAARLQDQIDKFNSLYRNVQSGDRYALIYKPGQKLKLSLNGQILGEVGGVDFARALFGIWMSDRALNDSFRKRLLSTAR